MSWSKQVDTNQRRSIYNEETTFQTQKKTGVGDDGNFIYLV
jgi:hypothetical protein